MKKLEKSLDVQQKLTYDKVFGDYLHILESNPADLVNDFLYEH